MEPQIIHLPAFNVVGMKYRGKNEKVSWIIPVWG
jgi:hypothetical protein